MVDRLSSQAYFISDLTFLNFLLGGTSQNAVGFKNQNQNQKRKGEDGFIITGNIAGAEAFRQTQNQAAQHGAGNAADAAQYSRRKGFDTRIETDIEINSADM